MKKRKKRRVEITDRYIRVFKGKRLMHEFDKGKTKRWIKNKAG